MNMDSIPLGILFMIMVVIVIVAINIGHKLGRIFRLRSDQEKESPVTAISAAILSLVVFMLAFTFGMAAQRYNDRMGLVRQESNAIGTAYLRSDFLPAEDRGKAAELFRKYLDVRLFANPGQLDKVLNESRQIQHQLWSMAVINARKDTNNVAAMYVQALNDMFDVQELRLAVLLESRIPAGFWLILYLLVMLGMVGVGYQMVTANSSRGSWAAVILAVSFSLVLTLIVSLDRPRSGFIKVSQQPLVDLRSAMENDGR